MNADELGAIAAVIGKNRESCPAEWLPGYDAKVESMALERQRQQYLLDEYNRLAADGWNDAQIERIMAGR